MKTLITFLILLLSSLTVSAKIGIVVNRDYYPSIATEIHGFMSDLATYEGKDVWLDSTSFDENDSIQWLRDTLKAHYDSDNLEGAIFIGALPIAMYEMEKWRDERSEFPTDLYFMDLDGDWQDNALDGDWNNTAKTGYFDDHQDGAGDRQVEIWMSRIIPTAAPGLGYEVPVLRDYLSRASKRMKGKDIVARRCLALGSSLDWGLEKGDQMLRDIGYPQNNVVIYNNPFDSSVTWQKELRSGYEYACIFEHSGPEGNGTNASIGGPDFKNTDYINMDVNGGITNARFYNLYACSNSKYTVPDCMGALYAWGHNGLISMGVTKSGSMLEYQYYNDPLSKGVSFGESFKKWLNDFAITNDPRNDVIMEHIYWYYGAVLLGAGTIRMIPYSADIEAPSNLIVNTINAGTTRLDWHDNSGNENGFQIECATGTGPFIQITTVGADNNFYLHDKCVQGTKYRYRVSAYNSLQTSLYSNIDSGVTFTNGALSGTATASSELTGYGAANVKDNSTSTRWTASSGSMPQWVTIDLGSVKSINGFEVVFPFSGFPDDCYDFVVATSQDNVNWTTLLTLDPNTNQSNAQEYLNYKAVARYVQMTINDAPGSYYASILEFRVLCDSEPPAPVLNPSTDILYNQVEFSWSPALGATSYTVKRSMQPGGPYLWWESGITGTTYKTRNLEHDHNYYFVVCGVNDAGEGAPSNDIVVHGHLSYPPPCENLTISPVCGKFSYILNWTDVSLDENRYEVERATFGFSDWVVIGGHNRDTCMYIDSTVNNAGTNYYQYRVAAIGVTGLRSYSSIVTSQIPPCAPSDLAATVLSSSEVRLDWTDNSTNDWGFHIERQSEAGGAWNYVNWVTFTTYTDNLLTGGSTYSYRVHSFNAFGDSKYSNEVTVTTPQSGPAAPSNLIATAVASNQINLSWVDNANNENGFEVERSLNVNGPWSQIGTAGANTIVFYNSNLSGGITYWYRVRAFNGDGNSDWSNSISAKTPSGGYGNLALSGTVSASSAIPGSDYSVDKVNDDNTSTRWTASSGTFPQWVKVDLGRSRVVNEAEMVFAFPGSSGDCYDFTIQTSNDNVNWTTKVNQNPNWNTLVTQRYGFSATARYVRITITGAPGTNRASLYEFRVFGQ